MRHIKAFAVCLATFLVLCSMSVMAYTLPHTYPGEGGITTIGVFEIAKWKDNPTENGFDLYAFWQEVRNNPRVAFFYDRNSGRYSFFIVPEGAKIVFRHNSYEPTGLLFHFENSSGQVVTTKVNLVEFERSGENYIFYRVDKNFNSTNGEIVMVGGSYFNGNPVSGLTDEVLARFPDGRFMIEDDLGKAPPTDEDETKGFWQTLLDWLSSFWDKLIGLFVPSDGFFDDWFAELRAAAMKKFGSLSKLSDDLNAAFEQMKNTTSSGGLILDVPANHFYKGFPGVRVDLLKSVSSVLGTIRGWLTAVCVVLTAVACYKRLIVLFEQ